MTTPLDRRPRRQERVRHAALLAATPLLMVTFFACSDEGATPVPTETPKKDAGAKDSSSDAPLAPDTRPPSPGCPASTFRLRAVAANLTSGTAQSWDAGHGARILKGLVPDVALMQEFNVGDKSASATAAFVASTFDASFAFVRGSGDIPNGVVSRYPIVASGNWTDPAVSNRAFTWARIDLPGARDLLAVSVHLLTSGDHGGEGAALATAIAKEKKADDFVVIGGDFNTKVRNDAAVTALASTVVTDAPYPSGPAPGGADPTNTNEPRSSPYDWVLASSALDAAEAPVAIGAKTFANGLVFDSAYFTPLADVAPVLVGDSHATGMQHMAVVRDFIVPCE